MKFVAEAKRSHTCGELRVEQEGQEVVLMGWVDSRRDHGGLVFLDLRDRYGLTQVVLDPAQESTKNAKDMRSEYVIALQGVVRKRPEGMANSKLSTGAIEVIASRSEILSAAETPPIQVNDEKVTENMRLKYRYLDLRSRRLQNNLQIRHRLVTAIRNGLNRRDFLEVETPILYKSTPEGARDYLVPSRVHPGSFYALPQSPQTLKQLLMIAGYDKYYQIARCFRDEDLRADRQPEFTQLDLEMSFVDVDDVLALNEALIKEVWQELKGVKLANFPRMTYQEAMNRFGCDKPDLRFGMELIDLQKHLAGTSFQVFADAIAREDGAVKGIVLSQQASALSRARIDKLTKLAQKFGARGLVWVKWDAGKISSPVGKFFTDEELQKLLGYMGAGEGDVAFIVADAWSTTCAVLSQLRLELAEEFSLIDKTQDSFLWVTDFPLLDYSPEDQRWYAMHHPFTSVGLAFEQDLLEGRSEKFAAMTARAYDLVCNGYEIAGGSIRIHNSKLQEAMFRALGISAEEAEQRFGFFVEALRYGTPPHGGIAWGIDRISMILSGTDSIRDVIAFPKTAKAYDLMADAPSLVDRDQLLELSIRVHKAESEAKESL